MKFELSHNLRARDFVELPLMIVPCVGPVFRFNFNRDRLRVHVVYLMEHPFSGPVVEIRHGIGASFFLLTK